MPEITVSPAEAAVHCSASIAIDHAEDTAGHSGWKNVYRVTAREGGDWRFVRFEWDIRAQAEDVDNEWHGTKNKVLCRDLGGGVYDFCDGNYTFEADIDYGISPIDFVHRFYKATISNLVAVFEKNSTEKHNVSTSAFPVKAAVTTGDGDYDDGTTCTINATAKCSPWIFDHWELTPGGTVRTKEHSFVVTEDTNCVAHYLHTNTGNPYDKSGNILCDSSGNILYDGDLVTPS